MGRVHSKKMVVRRAPAPIRGGLIIGLATSLWAPASSYAWTLSADFEAGTVGARANGTSGFGYATTQTFFSETRAHGGVRSARVGFLQGAEEGTGGSVGYPNLSEGDEIWARGYFYFASPFSWACSPVVKILRIRVNTASDSHVAWHSVFANSQGQILLSNEVQSHQPTTNVRFDVDQWQSIEIYVKFSATAGIIRIWKNGQLVIEDKSRRTLAASSNVSNQSNVFTYWNGGHPQTQYGWIDDFVWTSERPSSVDAHGNPMIGPTSTRRDLTVPFNLRY
ncbi:MAG: hypothetical protein IPK13_24245 [Deltaproteobacteria bacterium]|nr:hypothetical protein [Deltaproteobacteria bacterium]